MLATAKKEVYLDLIFHSSIPYATALDLMRYVIGLPLLNDFTYRWDFTIHFIVRCARSDSDLI